MKECLIILFILSSSLAHGAALESYRALPQPISPGSNVSLLGSFGVVDSVPLGTIEARMQTDGDMSMIESVRFIFNHAIPVSGDFSSGGRDIRISGMITFDFTLEFDETFAHNSGFGIPTTASNIEGSYTFSSPMETVSDTFSVNYSSWFRSEFPVSPVFDTSNYPDEVSFTMGSFTWGPFGAFDLFSTTVDGVEVSVRLAQSTSLISPIPFSFVPEPSTTAQIASLCLVLFVFYKRKKENYLMSSGKAEVRSSPSFNRPCSF